MTIYLFQKSQHIDTKRAALETVIKDQIAPDGGEESNSGMWNKIIKFNLFMYTFILVLALQITIIFRWW